MIKNTNKLLVFLLIILTFFVFSACKKKIEDTNNSNVENNNEKQQDANQATPTQAPSNKAQINANLTALELSKLMGNGINLGNTLEAYGRATLGVAGTISAYETFWGQPVTSKEIIQGMKDSGFDSLRIPVAWTNTMDFENDNFQIREDYMDRVEEIVNYALDADMYVIINDHWDGGWWGMFGSASQKTKDKAMTIYTSMWSQIAERFKDYSEYVIFESANEELGGRLNDKDHAEDSGSLSENDCYELTNKINQVFVDLIRKSGGNNDNRFLLIAGYNTDIEKTVDNRFKMPTDTADNKLLVSVHYYTPWGYCGNSSLSKWDFKKDYIEQNELLEKLTKFTDKGYGVVIGEYSVALKDDGSVKENTVDFFNNFLNNCDKYNLVPMLWDCSTFYKRRQLKIVDEGVANLYKSRSLAMQATMTEEEIILAATKAMEEALELAREIPTLSEDDLLVLTDENAIAWIMFNSGDWTLMYNVGDKYEPRERSDGLITTDVEITGKGTYTVGLDFTNTYYGFANGTAFSALGIANGEILYPGYVIDIKEILVNGNPYTMESKPYTSSDDGITTRVNLYNEWINGVPDNARLIDDDLEGASPIVINSYNLSQIQTLDITFEYRPTK